MICGWKGGAEKYFGTVKKVNPRDSLDAEQTYKILYEPPEGGYYKSQIKPGRGDEPDTEVLYIFKDGKFAPPLYGEAVAELLLTRPDGSVPVSEQRFRRVAFIQLRAQAKLDWAAFCKF